MQYYVILNTESAAELVRTRGSLTQNYVPYLIVNDLMYSSPSFPPGTSPPFTLSRDFTHLLHRICEVQIYIRDKVLCDCVTFGKPTQRTGQEKLPAV
jgi:hypothetical protein